MELARRFHLGATDKAGRPYLSHIQRVVDGVTTSDQKLAAALHDLLEDTPLSSSDLLAAGCPPRIIVAVQALTREPDEDYETFLQRAASDTIAHAVKVADVADNANESRLGLLAPEEAARLRSKYQRANVILRQSSAAGPEALRRLQEADLAEIGIPSGQADAWTTYWCVACGRPSGTLTLIDHDVVLATFLGRMTIRVSADGLEEMRLLLTGEADRVFAHDRELAPFWCPRCTLTYCGAHWTQETRFDGNFFDEVRGTCPNGHSRCLWD